MPTHILAIDQGTTGTTVGVLDQNGTLIEKVTQEFEQIYPQPGWVEHHPDSIYKSVQMGIQRVINNADIRITDIAAIGITNQRETVVVWDRQTHEPIHNAIVWQCRRTQDFCETLKKEKKEKLIRKKTGLVIDPYFSASKLRWILKNVKGAKQKAVIGDLAAGTIDTFLLWKLTGGTSFKTDVSNASRTQLLNIHDLKWDPELLRLFEVPERILPEVMPSSGVFGTTKGLSFLPDGIPIAGMAGDQQAALFGQMCFQPGQAKCTFGTGSFMLMNTGHKIVDSAHKMLATIAWQLKGQKPIYAIEGGAFICGGAVQWLRDGLGIIKESAEIEALAESVTSAEGVELVPAFVGLGAPYWNADARGMICGLTRGSTKGHIARATLDAMALQNVDILLAMQRDLEKKLKCLKVDGGASSNNLLMQLQADYLGVQIERPRQIESTVLGAGFLAGLGVGFWKDVLDLSKIAQIDRIFESKMTAADRKKRLSNWQTAVNRALQKDGKSE